MGLLLNMRDAKLWPTACAVRRVQHVLRGGPGDDDVTLAEQSRYEQVVQHVGHGNFDRRAYTTRRTTGGRDSNGRAGPVLAFDDEVPFMGHLAHPILNAFGCFKGFRGAG